MAICRYLMARVPRLGTVELTGMVGFEITDVCVIVPVLKEELAARIELVN